MNIEIELMICVLVLSSAALISSLIALRRNKHQIKLIELDEEKIWLLEETLAESRRSLEESQKTVADHSRRIAWLDANIRRNRFVTAPGKGSANSFASSRTKINEKRSRVLILAERGQDPATIAATLGMMPGEVELMLSLNNHNAALA